MSEHDPESAPSESSSSTVWTSTLDKRYIVIVQRIAPYQGELTIRDGDQLVHRERVGLTYDAIFGPDVDDVAIWQEIAVKVVDTRPTS
jgi:hypothetical protein